MDALLEDIEAEAAAVDTLGEIVGRYSSNPAICAPQSGQHESFM